ncbi:MAG TPA: protein TolQ [Caulobacteraceae bacterium]|jgi:biopolymer transport protein TolQ|nr:protein TolQ [Caulobacteraceae bacterium]
MDAQSALTPESFSIIAVFLRADWVVKLVLVGLILASVWSWTIIIDKLVRFAALNRQADRFEREVASGRSLEEVAAEAGPDPRHALPRMLQAALRDWREGGKGGGETAIALLLQRIDRALDSIIAREGARVEEGLGSLAIVATASPFVGLFGTVWGIMHAFQAIAVEKNTNLAVVAPAIAEALFATAVGLAAAIPAYIAYNKFSTDAGKFTSRLEGFADELSAAVSRRLSERIKG